MSRNFWIIVINLKFNALKCTKSETWNCDYSCFTMNYGTLIFSTTVKFYFLKFWFFLSYLFQAKPRMLPWSRCYHKQIPAFSPPDYRHFPQIPKHRQHLLLWKTKYLMVSLFQGHWLPAWKTKNNLLNSLGKCL